MTINLDKNLSVSHNFSGNLSRKKAIKTEVELIKRTDRKIQRAKTPFKELRSLISRALNITNEIKVPSSESKKELIPFLKNLENLKPTEQLAFLNTNQVFPENKIIIKQKEALIDIIEEDKSEELKNMFISGDLKDIKKCLSQIGAKDLKKILTQPLDDNLDTLIHLVIEHNPEALREIINFYKDKPDDLKEILLTPGYDSNTPVHLAAEQDNPEALSGYNTNIATL